LRVICTHSATELRSQHRNDTERRTTLAPWSGQRLNYTAALQMKLEHYILYACISPEPHIQPNFLHMLLVMAVARFFSGGVAVVMYFRFGGWRHIFPWWVLWLRRRKYIWCSSLWLTRGSTDFSSQRTLKPTYERQAVDRSGAWCLRRLSCFFIHQIIVLQCKNQMWSFYFYLFNNKSKRTQRPLRSSRHN